MTDPNLRQPAPRRASFAGREGLYLQEILRELTQSKIKLEEDRIRTDAMINSLGEGLIEMNEQGNITKVNPYALTCLGFQEHELIGAWFPGVIVAVDQHGQATQQLKRPLIRALTTGQPVSEPGYYKHKKGHIIPVFITVSPIVKDGKPIGAIQVFRDLTSEHQLDIAKDEFVSLASHQLRTPATGVKVILSMLSKGDFGPLSPTQQKYLDKAIQSNDRQLSIIEDLLNVARVDAGKLELNFEYVDLVPLLRTTVVDHIGTIQERSQSLRLNLPTRQPAFLDAQKIRMVIDNLVSNASKYTQPGGTIELSLAADTTDSQVAISVKDDGIGLTQSEVAQIFAKFTRLDNELSASVSGTGLGLFLVKNIVELHNGQILVDSEKGKGSTFTICIPVIGKPV